MTTQAVLDYLSSFNPSGSVLTPSQIESFTASLKGLINELSVAVPNAESGAITLLYSGKIGDGLPAWETAKALVDANPNRILTIDQTEVGKLLNSTAFQDSLKTALNFDDALYQKILNGTDVSGQNRISNNALFDDASSRFANNATGDVRTLVPLNDPTRVFAATELPAILNNPNVTSIDGIPKVYYQKMLADGASFEQVRATVAQVSLDRVARLEVSLDDQGRVARLPSGDLRPLGTTGYFDGTPINGSGLASGTSRTFGGNVIASAIDSGGIPHVNSSTLSDAVNGVNQLKTYAALDNATGVLNKLGIIGDVAGLMLAANDANAAYAEGNVAGGNKILKDWALDFAGGLAGGLAAAELVGTALAPLYLTGPAGAVVAGGLTVLAGLAGGFFGGQALKNIIDLFGGDQPSVIDTVNGSFDTASITLSPIVLDLDGDGVETTKEGAGTYFDHDANGFAESTGWAGKDDGILVRDINGNGRIDSGRELFGSETLLVNGQKAANGFVALAELDTNQDGKVDSQDLSFNTLKVWKDTNGDGFSSQSELLSLNEAGVQSINVIYTNSNMVDASGNAHKQIGSFTDIEGGISAADDVWFKVDKANSVARTWLTVPLDISSLPDLKGYGNVYDLHQAMVHDASGHLKDLIVQFTTATTSSARNALILPIIYAWAGVEHIDPASRIPVHYGTNNVIGDARKLATLEAVLGKSYLGTWCWGERDPNPHGPASIVLLGAFDKFASYVEAQLISQTYLKPVFDEVIYHWDSTTNVFVGDITPVATYLINVIVQDRAVGKNLLYETVRALKNMDLLSQVNAAEFRESFGALGGDVTIIIDSSWSGLVATGGSDNLSGTLGIDNLRGLAGNDNLNGLAGNDVLDGGAGNDVLIGGLGHDIYLFERNFGQDVILDNDSTANNVDVIRFIGNILPSEISVTRDSGNLYLSINDTQDRVMISGWFNSTSNKVERVEFQDGTVWNSAALESLITVKTPTENADVLYGGVGAEDINGLAGNDVIVGNAGDDTINGGTGNDQLEGNSGDDSYVFERGWGNDVVSDNDVGFGMNDTILFGANIVFSEVIVTRDQNNLYLSLVGTTDKITLKNWFTDLAAKIEKVQFSDGTIWDESILIQKTLIATESVDYLVGLVGSDSISGLGGDDTIYGAGGDDILNGGDGVDIIYGEFGDDVLDGGSGNDQLYGGVGADTYLFTRNSGQDVVIESDLTNGVVDKIIVGADIAATDVHVSKVANDLFIEIPNTDSRITIKDWFLNNANRVEQLIFTDGTVFNAQTLEFLANSATSYSDLLVGTSGSDFINGLQGNDEIIASDGDDTLIGGIGDDSLKGGAGNDTYLFSLGSGKDTIYENDSTLGNADAIQFDLGIAPEDIQIAISGNNLILTIVGTSDSITIQNWYSSSGHQIESIIFADGTTWSVETVQSKAIIFGTSGNDVLYGSASNDLIDGGAGNDILYGYTNYSGLGNDTFVFRQGSGQDLISDYDATIGNLDTIKIVGKLPSEVTLSRGVSGSNVSSDLVISINGTTDKLTVANYFSGSNYKIEKVVFDNGTEWTTTELDAAMVLPTVAGGVYGTTGNDGYDLRNAVASTIYEVSGYGNGDDVYVFAAGSGQDTITDYSTNAGNIDTIKVIGKLPSEVTLSRGISGNYLSNDLVISINGTTDKVTVQNYFSSSNYKIEKVQFDDGTVWTTTELDAAASIPVNSTLVYGTTGSDTYDLRNAANSTVWGSDGSNSGNDTYVFAAGSGQDIIQDYGTTAGNIDTIKVIGKLPSEVTLSRGVSGSNVSSDLLISINGTTDKLTVANYFSGSNYKIEKVVFDNGTEWTTTELDAAAIIPSSAGTVYGTTQDDTYNLTNATNVYINENNGYGNGNDTYIFAAGSGQDTIVDYSTNASNLDTIKVVGKLPSEVTLSRGFSGTSLTSDLVISINGTTDKLTVANYFASSSYKIEKVQFDNGTIWTTTELDQAAGIPTTASTFYGMADNNSYDLRNVANSTINENNGYGNGNDTYIFAAGSGQDTIVDYSTNASNLDTIKVVGKLPSEVTLSRLTNDLVLSINGTTDKLTVVNYFTGTSYKVENVRFDNGIIWTFDDLLIGASGADTLTGSSSDSIIFADSGNDVLSGLAGNDYLNGGMGSDSMSGGTGDDTFVIDTLSDVIVENANEGKDQVNVAVISAGGTYTLASNLENATLINTVDYSIAGNGLDNYMLGNTAVNTLSDAAGGNDIYQGLAGADTLTDTVATGNNVFDGGADNDTITGGAGNDLFIGGFGVDSITTGTGYDVVAFNKGDGQDTINASTGTDNTISLGGNFSYSDLSLTKSTDDLILKVGTADQITLKDWYLGTTNKSVVNLQVIAEAMTGFNLGGADALRDNKVENFNFANLVAAFDAAGATANWQLTDARLTAHLQAGSDTAAIGGDLAYQYGKNSNLTGMGLLNAQSVISAANFGQTAQTLNNPSVWQAELVKLG